MNALYTIIFPALCLCFMAYVLYLVSKGRLNLKYSLLWIALSIAMIIICMFNKQVGDIVSMFGFQVFSNFVFAVGLGFLLIITLALTSIASRQADAIRLLTQKLALVQKELEDQQESPSSHRDESH